MNAGNRNKFIDKPLTDIFNAVTFLDLHNREVAALMGIVDENSPGALPGGIISRYGHSDVKAYHLKKKKKRQQFINMILRESVRQALTRINAIIEYHQKQIEKLLQHIQKAEDLLDKLDNQHQCLNTELKYFQDNGFFDLDENGCLKNIQAEEILGARERKASQTIDRSNPGSYDTMLNILVNIEERRIEIKIDNEKYTAEYEYHKAKLDDSLQIRDALQRGDVEQSRKALLDFEDIINGYEENFDNGSVEKSSPSEDNDDVSEALEVLLENIDDDFSLGFPPLKSNFTKVVSDQEQSAKQGTMKKAIEQKSTRITKPDI